MKRLRIYGRQATDEAADRIEQLEAELKLIKEQRNEGGEMILKLVARIEQLKAALRDYLMFLRKSVNVGPLTKNPSKEAAHLRRLIALIPDVAALAPEQDKARCDQCPEPMEGPHHPECYRFLYDVRHK